MPRNSTKPTRLQTMKTRKWIMNEQGVIDLASVMVGIIVIGMIGGVIAATIFAVIPWSQDQKAKHQLDSIVTAENAHMGMSSASPSLLPGTSRANSYGDSVELEAANLLIQGKTYCVIETPDGKDYNAYSQSATGKVFTATNKNTKPELFNGSLPPECQFIADSYTGPPLPYVDPTPKLTKATYMCSTTTTGAISMNGALTGTETWSDGLTRTYTNAANPTTRTLTAGVTYTVSFEGTYLYFNSGNLQPCLRSLDHWGDETGATSGMSAFSSAYNLVSVPQHIPPTVTRVEGMFSGATIFNDPNISKWDTKNIGSFFQMFTNAKAFNQNINNWNMSKATSLGWMFYGATSFNQPLDKWDVSKVQDMGRMFEGATSFNQNINSWNTSSVGSMAVMFWNAKAFNQPLNNWNTSNVTTFNSMFLGASSFNQPLDKWNTSKATSTMQMFTDATSFNQNIDSWDTSLVTEMASMFSGAKDFNQPLNSWNVSKNQRFSYMFAGATSFNQPLDKWVVTGAYDMTQMFNGATAFNQNINSWNTSNITTMTDMFKNATSFNQPLNGWDTSRVGWTGGMFAGAKAFNQPLDQWKTGSVTIMDNMFDGATAFNQPINTWNVSNVIRMNWMFQNATSFNQPLNNWDTAKVTSMAAMFYNDTNFVQDLSGWNTTLLTNAGNFAPRTFPVEYLPAKATRQ